MGNIYLTIHRQAKPKPVLHVGECLQKQQDRANLPLKATSSVLMMQICKLLLLSWKKNIIEEKFNNQKNSLYFLVGGTSKSSCKGSYIQRGGEFLPNFATHWVDCCLIFYAVTYPSIWAPSNFISIHHLFFSSLVWGASYTFLSSHKKDPFRIWLCISSTFPTLHAILKSYQL